MIITIEFPIPPRILHPNARSHYMAKSRATKQYRNLVCLLALSASGNARPRWERATVSTTWFFQTRRGRDGDNLIAWMKAGFDGLADAGIVSNDKFFRHEPPEIQYDKTNPRVFVRVEKT
jgi:crossover junction endodeoxyribonuclease RusA